MFLRGAGKLPWRPGLDPEVWPVDPPLGSVYEWLGWGFEGGEEVEGGGGRGKLERVGLVVGLGVASLKRARGLCSFLAVLKIASPLSRHSRAIL